jgi:hypothetical protein
MTFTAIFIFIVIFPDFSCFALFSMDSTDFFDPLPIPKPSTRHFGPLGAAHRGGLEQRGVFGKIAGDEMPHV